VRITGLYTRQIITAEKSDTIVAVASRLSEHDIGALAVMEKGRLIGIISERDLVRAIAQGDSPQASIADRMSIGAAWIAPDADSHEVAHKMLALGIRHLPVVEMGRVLGMISARDLLGMEAGLAYLKSEGKT
jgi:CBS domain-containing protein